MTKKIVILDRDGVVNEESPEYIKHHTEWHPIPGSLEAIATLAQRGFEIVIATNQSGIGRGLYDEAALNGIHDKMQTLLKDLGGKVHHIAYCPHHPEAKCACRKPAIGLLQQIAEHYDLPFPFQTPIPFIGDSMRDLMAAARSGCLPILVLTGNGAKTLNTLQLSNDPKLSSRGVTAGSTPESDTVIQFLTALIRKKTLVCEDLFTAVQTLDILQADSLLHAR